MSDGVFLVVGADGTIGSALFRRLDADGFHVVRTTRRRHTLTAERRFLDLAASSIVEALDEPVAVAVITAAVARLPACAKDPEGSRLVNVTRTIELAERLARSGAHLVYLSTDKVFDGSVALRQPHDAYSPTTEYGRQKADAERGILAIGNAAVLRLTKVLAAGDPLLSGWRRDLLAGKAIRPFTDMQMAPIPLDLVTEAIIRIARARASGHQLSGRHDVSYAEAAQHLASRIGASPSLVAAVSTREAGVDIGGPTARFTTLAGDRLDHEFGLSPPDVLTTIESASVGAAVRAA